MKLFNLVNLWNSVQNSHKYLTNCNHQYQSKLVYLITSAEYFKLLWTLTLSNKAHAPEESLNILGQCPIDYIELFWSQCICTHAAYNWFYTDWI